MSMGEWHPLPDAAAATQRRYERSRRLYARFRTLDELLTDCYWYYTRRGFVCICSEKITYVLTVGFTTLYAPWLVLFVDWSQLLRLDDVDECAPFRYMGAQFTPFGWACAVVLWLPCLLFWLLNVYSGVRDIRRLHAIRTLWRIANHHDDLSPHFAWDEACEHIAAIVETLRLPELSRRLTGAEITQRVTRLDGFMTAFVNHALLDCPTSPIRFHQSRLTKTMEWCIARCVFDGMLKPDGTLDLVFVHAPHRLRRRFQRMGGLMAVLMPFLLVFIAFYYFFKYAEQVYRNPAYMSTRRWSPYARWRMRVDDELPHDLSQRLVVAYHDVDRFVERFPQPLPGIWGRLASFLLGSLVGTILVVGIGSERSMLCKLGEHDLLWTVAILSSAILLIRATTEVRRPSKESAGVNLSTLQACMTRVPLEWHSTTAHRVALDLQRLCPPVALLFASELCGILTTPLHLAFSLAHRASELVEFVQTHAVTVENVGLVCRTPPKPWYTS